MLAEGEDRKAAETAVDLALELARYLRSLSLTVEESWGSLAVAIEASFGAE